jgi:hypothetical protein
MKFCARSVAFVLPLFLAGCFHIGFRRPVQPLAPPIDAASRQTPPPIEHPPVDATIACVRLAYGAPTQPVPRPKPRIRRKRPANANSDQAVASTQQAAPSTQQAPANAQQAAGESPVVSAIGRLSSGDPSDLRQQTVDSIASIERSLNSIGSNLSDQDQHTAAQIREYLKQARDALASGDVDGAHTLAAKAKVLLGELSR